MSLEMPESDWKIFRQLRAIALERLCEGILSEMTSIASQSQQSSHERYLAVFKHLHLGDDEIANSFNNPRRSTAMVQLARMHWLQLLTDEEISRFGPKTRETLQAIANL